MILVTGGAGYIGSVTVDLLRARGEKVVVLDNLTRGHHTAVPADVPFYEGNIGDRELVTRIATEHEIEACIHFAALAYVGESVADPARYFENNVEQGVAFMAALLEAESAALCFPRPAPPTESRERFRFPRPILSSLRIHTDGQSF